MSVIIGVDPHKATHTAVAIDRTEVELARAKVRATCHQVPQLVDWATSLGERTWAIESAEGLGYLLSQQLIGAGETVVDVPSTLAARVRVLGTGRSDKNDLNDALSVAIAALRTPGLREVATADHTAILRLLAKRNVDIGNQRSRVVCRLHNLIMELSPGGIAKELNASDAIALLDRVEPTSPVEFARHDQALELLADIGRLDDQLKVSHKRIRTAVAASNTTVTDVFGIGPILACYLIGFTGDIGRFNGRDRYAAYNGTASVERSSGGRVVHRVSQRGNRRLNHALHMVAICQIRHPHSDGRRSSTARSPRARPRRTPSARSSGISRTPSTAASSRTSAGRCSGPGRTPRNGSVVQRGRLPSCTPALRTSHFPDPPMTLRPTPGLLRRARTRPREGILTQRGFVGGEIERRPRRPHLGDQR